MSGIPVPGASKLRAPASKLQGASKIQKPGTSAGADGKPAAADNGKKISGIATASGKGLPAPGAKSATAMPATPRKTATAVQPAAVNQQSALAVGDTVMTGGKRGVVRFLGTTSFAPGEWAGIELFEAQGKNDGTVKGDRYFKCAANHGLFAKPDKLERVSGDGSGGSSARSSSAVMAPPATPAASKTGSSRVAAATAAGVKPSPAAVAAVRTPARKQSMSSAAKVGDRVSVGGTKRGIVRFVGITDFAAGQWVGVELDKGEGKNDGMVQGKRYFKCPANHGLFSPLHKVEVLESGSSPMSRTSSQIDISRTGSSAGVAAVHMAGAAAVAAAGAVAPTPSPDAVELGGQLESMVESLREQLETSEKERQSLVAKLNEEER